MLNFLFKSTPKSGETDKVLSSCGTNESKENIDSIVEKMLSEKHSPIVFNPEPTPAFIVVKEPKDLKKIQNDKFFKKFQKFQSFHKISKLM
jgi:hypothetical protein